MQGGNYRQRQYRRRGRGPWFWIILAIIIISLMSGGFGSRGGFGFGPDRFGNNRIVENHEYTVAAQSTIIINDTNGNIQINAGDPSSSDVVIQDVKQNSFFGNANSIQVNVHQDSLNTINASVPDGQQGSVDFIVTVPQGTNLQLQTNSGDIKVTGVTGQMTLTTRSGDITASNDVINGSSSITTSSGDITAKQTTLSDQATISTDAGGINFDGTIDTTGTYQLQTNSGSVDLTLPSALAFHVDASTTSGSINSSDFPYFPVVQTSDPGSGAKATGDVGGSSSQRGAKLIINTGSGDINLHQG